MARRQDLRLTKPKRREVGWVEPGEAHAECGKGGSQKLGAAFKESRPDPFFSSFFSSFSLFLARPLLLARCPPMDHGKRSLSKSTIRRSPCYHCWRRQRCQAPFLGSGFIDTKSEETLPVREMEMARRQDLRLRKPKRSEVGWVEPGEAHAECGSQKLG